MKMAVEFWDAELLPQYALVQKNAVAWVGSGPDDYLAINESMLGLLVD